MPCEMFNSVLCVNKDGNLILIEKNINDSIESIIEKGYIAVNYMSNDISYEDVINSSNKSYNKNVLNCKY
jgi:hypothetical protein